MDNNVNLGFIWYDDNEIFKFSETDFENKVKKYYEAGINIVITFSCTHFRWSMKPYWKQINLCLGKLVDACHKYGIKVVEHHSSHLTFDPLNSDDWDYMERVLSRRRSSIDSWKGIRDYMASDPVISGKPLSSFRQVDGRSGRWARTSYHGYCMCFNNPDYRKEYFGYLKDVYKTGIDGIMTDDVQWFGDGHACACEHCRELFHKRTGFELPNPGEEWHKFYGDYDNPVYIAWEKFRRQSTEDFQRAVTHHYKSLNLKLIRPNYTSNALIHNSTGYPFEVAADMWDFIFQENCYSSIIRYSWPAFAMEAVHRYALSERYGVPSMSLFYPDRDDTYYFSWALAKSWGQLFLATPEGSDISEAEKPLRKFELKFNHLFEDCKKIADIAFYFSTKTRDFIKDSADKNMRTLYAWMQSAYLMNYAIDMVFENDTLNKLLKYPLLLVPCTAMMDDEELTRLVEYANNGGVLVILGIPGERDTKGLQRDFGSICRNLGVEAKLVVLDSPAEEEFNICFAEGIKFKVRAECRYIFDSVNTEAYPVMQTNDRIIAGISFGKGQGSVIWFPNSFGSENAYFEARADRLVREEIRTVLPEYAVEHIKEMPGKLLDFLISDRLFLIEDGSEEIIASCFMSQDGTSYILHLVNVSGTIPKEKSSAGHRDIIPSFTSEHLNYGTVKGFKVSIRKENELEVTTARLVTPESPDVLNLSLYNENNRITVVIPDNAFRGYAIVEVSVRGL